MLSITGICYSLRANSLQLAKSRLRCRMGGALAIPIDPSGGYRRGAPPPILQLSANKICSVSRKYSSCQRQASGRRMGGAPAIPIDPSGGYVNLLQRHSRIYPGERWVSQGSTHPTNSVCVGWVEALCADTHGVRQSVPFTNNANGASQRHSCENWNLGLTRSKTMGIARLHPSYGIRVSGGMLCR